MEVCPSTHRHAEALTCYTGHGCRCTPCVDNWSAYTRDMRRKQRLGKWTASPVDAAPARARLLELLELGYTLRGLAKIVGVSAAGLSKLARRSSGKVAAETARRILAIDQVEPVHEMVLGQVPLFKARRRVQALMARGYSLERQARMTGLSTSALSAILHEEGQTSVHTETFHKIDVAFLAYYDLEAECHPWDSYEWGNISRARNQAKSSFYRPAEAYNDIDDPEEVPPWQQAQRFYL